MLLSGSVSPDLLVDRGTPSLLHSTETVEDGGGLTLQGSTTVWPTKASTVDGSSLSMVTPPTVKLKTGQIRGQEEEGRIERREIEESETVTLCSTVGTLISCHRGKHKESPQPGAGDVSQRETGTEGTREWPKDTFIQQTTDPILQIKREVTHKRHEVRRDRTTDTANVRKEPLLV